MIPIIFVLRYLHNIYVYVISIKLSKNLKSSKICAHTRARVNTLTQTHTSAIAFHLIIYLYLLSVSTISASYLHYGFRQAPRTNILPAYIYRIKACPNCGRFRRWWCRIPFKTTPVGDVLLNQPTSLCCKKGTHRVVRILPPNNSRIVCPREMHNPEIMQPPKSLFADELLVCFSLGYGLLNNLQVPDAKRACNWSFLYPIPWVSA